METTIYYGLHSVALFSTMFVLTLYAGNLEKNFWSSPAATDCFVSGFTLHYLSFVGALLGLSVNKWLDNGDEPSTIGGWICAALPCLLAVGAGMAYSRVMFL